MAKLSVLFQNALGHDRDQISSMIQHFESAMHTQDKRVIAETREEIEQVIKRFEDHDVFT